MAGLSDAELRFLTDLAYEEITPKKTVRESLQTIYAEPEKNFADRVKGGNGEHLLSELEDPALSGCGDYRILDVCDMEDKGESGLYAYVVETDTNHAAIVVRGTSQGFEWITEDYALLNRGGEETAEQEEIRRYLAYIEKDPKYDDYSFSILGHSLGGELAMHAAITSSSEMKERIDRVVSMDGPGFSEEYLRDHASEIRKLTDEKKLEHAQWSVVGNLLSQPEGVSNRILEANDVYSREWDVLGIGRHDLKSLKIDEKGFFLESSVDGTARYAGALSKEMDAYDAGALRLLVVATGMAGTLRTAFPGLSAAALSIAGSYIMFHVTRGIMEKGAAMQADGIFETDLGGLRRAAVEMEDLSARLYELSADILSTAERIESRTARTGRIKEKLRKIAGNVEQDAKDMGFLQNLLILSVQEYHRADLQAEEYYRQVYVKKY